MRHATDSSPAIDTPPPSSHIPSGPPTSKLAAVARLAGAVPRPRLEPMALLVVRGVDSGATLRLEPLPKTIGRSRDVDLVLRDGSVSRRHFDAQIVEGGVRVTVASGAAPFVVGADQRTTAVLPPGASFVVGETVFLVQRASEPLGHAPLALPPDDVRALLQGASLDAPGLAAMLALVEVLDRMASPDEVKPALTAWAEARLGATGAAFLDATEVIAAHREALLQRPHDVLYVPREDGPGLAVYVPAHGLTLGWLLLELASKTPRLPDAARSLAVVAARVVASSVARLRALRVLRSDTAAYRQQAVGSAGTFLGRSPAAQRVSSLVQRIGRSDATVLLRGETGTGKSFVARLIHEASPRAQEPFRVINCASIPESLFESELFGHERGAFTGAVATRPGAFEAAGEGTVFLDEIGEMPLASQAKLLRVLEERRFERLGSNRSLPLGARVIAASNRDLHAMVKAGTFRADLLFRISVVHIDVPPLRERGDDVLLLARQILADLAPSGSRRVLDFAPCALDAIRAHRWPGNVRELRNAIESAVVLGEGPLVRAEDLALAPPSNAGGDPAVVKLPASLADLEVRALEAAMRACKGNRTRAAAILGINRVTLYKKLKGSQLDGDGDES